MHEIGIASEVVRAAQAEQAHRPGSSLIRVGIRVGVLAGVDLDALRFAFTALTQATDLESVHFDIESCPRENRCLDCGTEFPSALYSEPCPCCSSNNIALIGGEQLDIAFVELEQAELEQA